MPKVIEVIYENGVFKPLEKVDFPEKTKLKITLTRDKKDIIKVYRGIFGKAEIEELRNMEEEAQTQ